MKKNWLYPEVPSEWRIALIFLTISAFGIILIYGFIAFNNDTNDGLSFVLLGFHILLAVTLLLRGALRREESNDRSWFLVLVFVPSLVLLVYLASVFSFIGDQKKDARTRWIVSNICTQNGEIRQSVAEECAKTRGLVCKLGDNPIQPCEAELRRKLNMPVEEN